MAINAVSVVPTEIGVVPFETENVFPIGLYPPSDITLLHIVLIEHFQSQLN